MLGMGALYVRLGEEINAYEVINEILAIRGVYVCRNETIAGIIESLTVFALTFDAELKELLMDLHERGLVSEITELGY